MKIPKNVLMSINKHVSIYLSIYQNIYTVDISFLNHKVQVDIGLSFGLPAILTAFHKVMLHHEHLK